MPLDGPARPRPKAASLARGERRYRRKIASPKQWQAIIAAKIGPCRACGDAGTNGRLHGKIEFHHIVPRDQGGDDVADNIMPLCSRCHLAVECRNPVALRIVGLSLTDAEYAYVIGKKGEGALERLYGVAR